MPRMKDLQGLSFGIKVVGKERMKGRNGGGERSK